MTPPALTNYFTDVNRVCLIFKALTCSKVISEHFFGRAGAARGVLFSQERLHKMTSLKVTSSGQSPDDVRAAPASFLGARSALKIILEALRAVLAHQKLKKNLIDVNINNKNNNDYDSTVSTK
jgi:hypothetical protein